VRRSILDKNDRLAERNRGFFRARGLLVLNVLSSPGSGKTTLLRETIRRLGSRLKTGVIVGDLATDNDARRLGEAGATAVQITTGTVCHLEAEMVARALKQLDLTGVGLLVIENVGNLVCPASYDLGEDLRVVLLSVTEGEDKPLKYPPMFQSAGWLWSARWTLPRPAITTEIRPWPTFGVSPECAGIRDLRQNRPGHGRLVRFFGSAASSAEDTRSVGPLIGGAGRARRPSKSTEDSRVWFFREKRASTSANKAFFIGLQPGSRTLDTIRGTKNWFVFLSTN
jgi:hydrogenase accessory protein HypB